MTAATLKREVDDFSRGRAAARRLSVPLGLIDEGHCALKLDARLTPAMRRSMISDG